jgi:nucleoside-diphosphate-sugar epimerase
MAAHLNVVTGATGLLGSHVAEQLVARGEPVRALVRPSSDVSFLRRLGVELAVGDLHAPATLSGVFDGARIVYHCAARVGDWGTWEQFRTEVVESTRNVLAASHAARVGRVLHVSSVAVYGHPRMPAGGIGEDRPLGQRLRLWDHYCRAKIQAERVARAYGPLVTVVRPTWVFGPRDRNTMPRLVRALRAGWVALLGSGDNLLNIVHARDVAAGAIRAANHPDAAGQVYHLCSEGEVTQRQFLDALTDGLGLPRVTRRIPYPVALWGGLLGEVIARICRLGRAPYISRYSVGLMGRPACFRIGKARSQLEWQPRVPVLEGLRETLAWFRLQQKPDLPSGRDLSENMTQVVQTNWES